MTIAAQKHQLDVFDTLRPLVQRLESDIARREVVKLLWATVGVRVDFQVLTDIAELAGSLHDKEAKKQLIGFIAAGEGVQLKVPAIRCNHSPGVRKTCCW